MKVYAVLEPELRTIGVFNGLIPFFFSIGGGCLTLGIDKAFDLFISDNVPENAKLKVLLMLILCGIGAVSGFVLGAFFIWKRRKEMRCILTQTNQQPGN